MGLRKKLASTLAVGVIVLSGLFMMAPAAQATGNPNQLDRGDLTGQCRDQYGQQGWTAELYGSTAYSWKCVYLGNVSDKRNVDINAYCQRVYGVYAQTTNPNSPYAWRCQV